MEDAVAIKSEKEDEPPDEARDTARLPRTSSTSWPPAGSPTEALRRLVGRQRRQHASRVARAIEVAVLELEQRKDTPPGSVGYQPLW